MDNEYFMKGAVRAKRLVDLPKVDTMKHADAHRILERISAMKTTQNTVVTDERNCHFMPFHIAS